MCMTKKNWFTAHYVSVVLKWDARDENSDLFSTWYLVIHTSVAMHGVSQRLTHNNSRRVSRQVSDA